MDEIIRLASNLLGNPISTQAFDPFAVTSAGIAVLPIEPSVIAFLAGFKNTISYMFVSPLFQKMMGQC
jgi:hypothetical protein